MYEAEWRKLKHTKLLYEAGGFGKENAVALYAKILLLINAISPHWGLNPGPSVYKTDALPLSYRGLANWRRPGQLAFFRYDFRLLGHVDRG